MGARAVLPAVALAVALLAVGRDTRFCPAQERAKKAAPASKAPVAPEREAAARTFAKQHHPELLELLDALRRTHPLRYATAIRELYATCESLNRLRERDPERYEAELRLWKAMSRIQVLAARLTMGDDAQLKDELRRAIEEQIDARIALQKLARDRLRARMEQLERSIAEMERTRDVEVERRMKRILNLLDEGRAKGGAAAARKPRQQQVDGRSEKRPNNKPEREE